MTRRSRSLLFMGCGLLITGMGLYWFGVYWPLLGIGYFGGLLIQASGVD